MPICCTFEINESKGPIQVWEEKRLKTVRRLHEPSRGDFKVKILIAQDPIKKTDTSHLKNNVCLFKEIHPAIPLRQFQVH